MKRVKYFSKPATRAPFKQFSDDSQSIDASVVKTLCGVVDGLQQKVAEMADEIAALNAKNTDAKQFASTEEGAEIPVPAGEPVQPPVQIPEEVANGVADDPAPQVEVPELSEETVVAQFSAGKQSLAQPAMLGTESFNCLFDK